MIKIFNEVNHEQLEVLIHPALRKLVLAGPGSGKTRMLCAGVQLEADQYNPNGIVVITYTTAAAGELERRLTTKGVTGLGFVGTLHAFLLDLIRTNHAALGLPSHLTVIDAEEAEALLQGVVRDMGIKTPIAKVLAMARKAEQSKVRASFSKEELAAVEYRTRMLGSGLLDFDTILSLGPTAIRLAECDGWPYRALFVDEFQDSADSDWAVYNALPCERKLLVGDPDQSIYSFRGSNVDNILKLARIARNGKDWERPSPTPPDKSLATPEMTRAELEAEPWIVFKLERNYRCPSKITDVANKVISHNKHRVAKRTVPMQVGGDVMLHGCDTPSEETAWVLIEVQHMLKTVAPEQVAILTRTNRLADEFATALRAYGILVARAEDPVVPGDWVQAKLTLAALNDPYNDLVVGRLLELEKGAAEGKRLRQEAVKRMTCLSEVANWPYGQGEAGPSGLELDLSRQGLSAESRARIHDTCRELGSSKPDWALPDLLFYIASGERRKAETTGVHVGTVHGAKGREFTGVFLPGCEEGAYPSTRAGVDPEEERRLFFVAITRASNHLRLSWCRTRPESRGPNLPPGPPAPRQRSRFLTEAGL